MLRLEAQDLLHLRHVPRRRGSSGGETPERSPGAGRVNAAPPLNLERGGLPGRGRGSPMGCARGGAGDGLRGAGAGAEGEGEAAVPSERTTRTHARTRRRTHAHTQQAGRLNPARARERRGAERASPCRAVRRRGGGRGGGAAGRQGAGRRASPGEGRVRDTQN